MTTPTRTPTFPPHVRSNRSRTLGACSGLAQRPGSSRSASPTRASGPSTSPPSWRTCLSPPRSSSTTPSRSLPAHRIHSPEHSASPAS
ncbi:hypothetical protein BC567DRAFT_219933 [Phyllosticta citribraziliensis]